MAKSLQKRKDNQNRESIKGQIFSPENIKETENRKKWWIPKKIRKYFNRKINILNPLLTKNTEIATFETTAKRWDFKILSQMTLADLTVKEFRKHDQYYQICTMILQKRTIFKHFPTFNK